MQNNYELAFYGELVEGMSEQSVKESIAQLFKANTDQIGRMFTGRRVVIRNKMDLETAQKYVLAMRKRGAICQIEKMGDPGVKVDPSVEAKKAESPSPPPVSSPAADSAAKPSQEEASSREPGMNVAGDRVDEILSGTNFKLDPVGVRLSEERQVDEPIFDHIDDLSIAPVGSDLVDKKEELPTSAPDISHINLEN